MSKKENKEFSRRDFIKLSTALGVGATIGHLSLSACNRLVNSKPGLPIIPAMERVRVGIVGVGMQGSGHAQSLLRIEGVDLIAVCDLVEDKVKRVQEWATEAGKQLPKGYSNGELDYKRMCAEEELDLVITATPWEWHVPVCVEAMKTGSHAATEVPASVTIEGCWELVETAEKYQKHCMMLENVCYMGPEMMILNMARKGLFGEVIHGEGAYNHDLRNYKLGGLYENDWRVKHSFKRNGNLYPTHGLGPIAQVMNINRGDQFDYLVSMSTKSYGLQAYAKEKLGKDHPYAKADYKLGDVNTSMIMTKNGKTIYLVHDTNLPRPYSRINMIQGTNGITQGFGDTTHGSLIHIEGRSEPHRWQPLADFKEEFQHPLITTIEKESAGAGHGGADFIEIYRLINALRKGLPTDQDVYDAASWSVVSGLTEESVARKSSPVDFPDFTRGLWKKRDPLNFDDHIG